MPKHDPSQYGVLYKFLQKLSPEDKNMFCSALDHAELAEYCSSEDEYRVITGDAPKQEFFRSKPRLAKDAKSSYITEEDLQKRLDDLKKSLPGKLSKLKEKAYGSPPPESIADESEDESEEEDSEDDVPGIMRISIAIEQIRNKGKKA